MLNASQGQRYCGAPLDVAKVGEQNISEAARSLGLSGAPEQFECEYVDGRLEIAKSFIGFTFKIRLLTVSSQQDKIGRAFS